MLDPQLRPISPDPTNQLSQEIFNEHVKVCFLSLLYRTFYYIVDANTNSLEQLRGMVQEPVKFKFLNFFFPLC